MLNAHHLHPEHYTDLDPAKFRLVCSTCHNIIEIFAVRLQSKNPNIANKDKWSALLEGFLPL